MKYMKMLGLALVASAALMAFGGAGTASATKLCKNSTNTTTCSEPYAASTVIDATLSGSAILETSGGTVLETCTGSTLKGKTANAGGSTETLKEPIESLTWSGCTKEKRTLTLGELEFHWIAGTDSATLTARNTQWTVGGLFENESCLYGFGTGTDLGTVVGGTNATLSISALVPRQTGSGFLCPAETRWTASYKFTEPSPLYVTSS
jgi:hypothetical protein